jgi:hypothetical protein
VGLRVVGFQFERVAIRGSGFLKLTSLPKDDSQIVVGLRVVGLEVERAAESGNGVVHLACCAAGFAEIGMSEWIPRIEDDRRSNQLHREVVPAGLLSDDAKQVKRVRVVGLRCEDLTVERFGIRQPPGLMVLNRDLKRLWNRHIANCGLPESSSDFGAATDSALELEGLLRMPLT